MTAQHETNARTPWATTPKSSTGGNDFADPKILVTMKKPPRPLPSTRIVDYDDGDPYSCIAAGAAERQAVETHFKRVADCFEAPPEELQKLLRDDRCAVRTALYDIWENGRLFAGCRSRGEWAAQQMAGLGDTSLLEYDKAHPVGG